MSDEGTPEPAADTTEPTAEPSTDQLTEPSTEKEPGEEPKAPNPDEPLAPNPSEPLAPTPAEPTVPTPDETPAPNPAEPRDGLALRRRAESRSYRHRSHQHRRALPLTREHARPPRRRTAEPPAPGPQLDWTASPGIPRSLGAQPREHPRCRHR